MTVRDVPIDGPFGRLAAALLVAEFPLLPAERWLETVAFCCRRYASLPDSLRVGVSTAAGAALLLGRAIGTDRANSAFRRTRLPLVRDLARLVRSLAVAFIWERWPDTSPLGAPARTVGGAR